MSTNAAVPASSLPTPSAALSGSAEVILGGLNEEQRLAVTDPHTPLAIIAGAGAGKTRVLTRRVAYQAEIGAIEPDHTLVLTFTRKAAGELRSRLRDLGIRTPIAAGTFHAVAYAQLRRRWEDHDVNPPDLLDRKVGFVARLLGRNESLTPLDIVTEIEWSKARMIHPDAYVQAVETHRRRTPGGKPELIADFYDAYERSKRKAKLVDFDDLLAICRRYMLDDAEWARAQQWRHRHFFVDEFQDVNPLQFSLLQAWLGEAGDICVVGDPDQAIYGWNGANPELINEFADTFRAGRTLTLRRNHRSTPQILAMASSVLNGRRDFEAMVAPGPIPTVTSHDDDRTEARAVARAVRDNHAPGSSWSSQAVLARTNGQLPIIEETLGKLGIPCRTRGGAGLLSRPEVKNVLREWSADDRPLPLAILDLQEHVRELRAASMANLDEVDAGYEVDDDGPVGEIAEQCNNLETLIRVANDHLSLDSGARTDRFTRWARATFDHESSQQNAVELMTFHAAKGLEWPAVHLVGFEDGLVPIGHARTAPAQQEERRLAYVAMTRAENVLSIHWAQRRTFGSRSSTREPSPYIESMLAASDSLARGERPGNNTDHIRAIRRDLEQPVATAADDRLVSALKEWRLRTARAADVPAYVILHDATIGALAEQRPTQRSGLSSIPGIGPAKLDRYGDAILEIVAGALD